MYYFKSMKLKNILNKIQFFLLPKKTKEYLFGINVSEKLSDNLQTIIDGKRLSPRIILSETVSPLLKELGLSDGTIEMSAHKLSLGLLETEKNPHGHKESISSSRIKKLCTELGNPTFVTMSNSYTFRCYYNVYDKRGCPMMAVIESDKKYNIVLSVYGEYPRNNLDYLIYYDDLFFSQKLMKLPATYRKISTKINSLNGSVLTKSKFIKNYK